MNREAAKSILAAYRPGGEDADDPIFAEALRELERDPELRAWFADKEEFDSLIMAKLADSVRAPMDLKDEILARAGRGENRTSFRRWLKPALAIAAATVIAIVVWHFAEPRDPTRILAFQAIHYTREMPRMQFACFEASAVIKWIDKQPISREVGMKLTKPMKDMCLIGSSVIEWNGKPVLMLALQNDKQMAMFYLVHGEDFNIPRNANEITEENGWVSKVSSAGGNAWVLATKGTRDDLKFDVPF
jgi:hypothetical protein